MCCAHSPQMLAVEIPCTGTVFPGSFTLCFPGQELHQVVGGTEAALALNRFGRTNREEQGWAQKKHACSERKQTILETYVMYWMPCRTFMESAAEIWAAVSLVLTCAASLSFCYILTALTPNTQLVTTALHVPSTGLKKRQQKISLWVFSANSGNSGQFKPQFCLQHRCGKVTEMRTEQNWADPG